MAAQPSCSITKGGKTWDLSSLADSTDYNYTTPSQNASNTFYLNLCKPITSELYQIPQDQVDTLAAFLRPSKGGDISIGSTHYNLTLTDTSNPTPQIVMTGGAACPGGGGRRTSLVNFVCAAAASGATVGRGRPELMTSLPLDVDEVDRCVFIWEWRTSAACARPAIGSGHLSNASAVGVLIAMAIAVFCAWILGVVLYNRFILHLRGTDQLPSFSFPSVSPPSSIPNPFRRTTAVGSRWGRGGGGSAGGYGRVATGDEGGGSDEEEGLVGRFGLDSDDEEEDARALSGDPRVWRSDDGFPAAKPSTPSNNGGLINLG